MADSLDGAGPEVGLATSVIVPPRNRLAFGVIDRKTGFVYGATAIYVVRSPNGRALGPYPAPADSLITDPAYLCRGWGVKCADCVWWNVGRRSAGSRRGAGLGVTKIKGQLIGPGTQIKVIAS